MRKNSRAYKILEAGLAEKQRLEELVLPGTLVQDDLFLAAIAAMIDYATKKANPKDKPKMLYDEKAVLATLDCKLAVARHGGLNRQLRSLKLLETDLDQFRVWFSEVMQPWMCSKDIEFTYSMLVRKYPEWLEKARQHNGSSASTTTEEWR